jgi:hypothetical protein
LAPLLTDTTYSDESPPATIAIFFLLIVYIC